MVGCHYTKFSTIFNYILNDMEEYNGHIEDIWKLRTSQKVLVCDTFRIEPTRWSI